MTTCKARNSLGSTGISECHKNYLHMEQPGKFPVALRLTKRRIQFVWQIETEVNFTVQASLIPGKNYLHSAIVHKMMGNRDGSSFRKNLKYWGKISQIWTASESSLTMLCYPWYWQTVLQRLNKTYDIELLLKPFLLVLPVIVMENCFSLSPHRFCFHVYLALTPKILSMAVLSMLVCSV